MFDQKPDPSTYATYYHRYVNSLSEGSVLDILADQLETFTSYIKNLTRDQLHYSYAPEKWSICQLIVHVLDSERVFAYRMLAFSRGEKQNLPGFDQNEWIDNLNVDHRSVHDLAEEFITVRNATHALIRSFNLEQWRAKGMANNSEMPVQAMAWIIAGHLQHHMNILTERYQTT